VALSKEDQSDIKVGRALQAMIATEGWAHFVRLVDAHIETVKKQALQPFVVTQENKASHQVLFSALDSFLASESQKGAIMGLSLARDLPSGIISNMETLLKKGGE
jgi:hypothetical protein